VSVGDGEEILDRLHGGRWILSWHAPPTPPDGTPHGAAGICVTDRGKVVLVSQDGKRWELPGGRPEGGETLEETLRREVREEACATVVDARLLGFLRSVCIEGPEAGRAIVRSVWRADVDLAPWTPRFEMLRRATITVDTVVSRVTISPGLARIVSRALQEAALVDQA
jgi:hypothetical protein